MLRFVGIQNRSMSHISRKTIIDQKLVSSLCQTLASSITIVTAFCPCRCSVMEDLFIVMEFKFIGQGIVEIVDFVLGVTMLSNGKRGSPTYLCLMKPGGTPAPLASMAY